MASNVVEILRWKNVSTSEKQAKPGLEDLSSSGGLVEVSTVAAS